MKRKKVTTRVRRSREDQLREAAVVANTLITELQRQAQPTLTTLKERTKRPKTSILRDLDVLAKASPKSPTVLTVTNWRNMFSQSYSNEQRKALVELALEIKDSVSHWGFSSSTELAFAMDLNPYTLADWSKKFAGNKSLYFEDHSHWEGTTPGLLGDALNLQIQPLSKLDAQSMALDMLAERLDSIRNMEPPTTDKES